MIHTDGEPTISCAVQALKAAEELAEQVEPLVKDWTANDVLEAAKPIGNGYSYVEIELRKGDSAWCPGTTKYVLRGVGRVEYMIHASCVDATPFGDIWRSHKS